MPLTRQEARSNLVALVQQQITKPAEHGELLLAVWHDIEDAAQDLHLMEVFESFCAPDGSGSAVIRFPGMAGLWLPGLYFVSFFSREAFEAEAPRPSSPLTGLRGAARSEPRRNTICQSGSHPPAHGACQLAPARPISPVSLRGAVAAVPPF